MIFIESRGVTARLKDFLDTEAYRAFQNVLLATPTKGRVMPGCGGLRKIRAEDLRRGKGKRGGARIIYLYMPEVSRIDLLAIYGKDEQDDLSAGQRKVLALMARQAKAEAVAAARKNGRKP
jgi:putative transcriptional regulator